MNDRALAIGEAANRAGVSPDTLRYYERLGLLTRVGRTSAGYRQYSDSTIEQVRFVRTALRFGFSLKQVARFLRARESGRAPCREVRAAGQDILDRVDQQIKELKAARRELQQTLKEWDRRLSHTPAGQPARLLHTLKAEDITTDCLSARLCKASGS
jgi:MerR family copper efflux transcriptional regulator